MATEGAHGQQMDRRCRVLPRLLCHEYVLYQDPIVERTDCFCLVGGLAIAAALGIQPELNEIASLAPVVYVWLVPAVVAVGIS